MRCPRIQAEFDRCGVQVKRAIALAALAFATFVSLPALADQEEPPAGSGGSTPLPPLPPITAPEPAPPAGMIVEPARRPAMLPPTPPKFTPRVELKVGGGATYKSLFGLPMTMGTIDVGLGGQLAEMVAFNMNLDLDFGKTAHGLTTRAYTIAPVVEIVADRFRLGFGPEALWFGVTRATTGAVIAHGGLGLRILATFDVVKTDSVALFVGGRGQIDYLFSAGLFSTTGSAGLRF